MHAVQRRSKAPLIGAITVVAAVLAKRAYPKAAFAWLVKRFLGFLLGRVLPFPIPQVIEGPGSLGKLGSVLQQRGSKKPLIVTDDVLVKHGLVQPCLDSIKASGLEYEVFDKVVPNPPASAVEEGFEVYKSKGCDSIVAFGGGSPMDTAKVIGAKVCNPMPVKSYHGVFKATMAGLKKLPPFIAVPTTAGTGSETTIAAIITIPEEKSKVSVLDLGIVPQVAMLDPEILVKLPKHISAATGMDALTHAIESYVSGWSSGFTRPRSLEAVTKIFKYLTVSYDNGADLQARTEMLDASFKAGLAFTRAGVGYVHAVAHQLGGMFHTPHGDANAMLLPYVLDFYLEDEKSSSSNSHCIDLYCQLAEAGGLAQSIPADRDGRQKLAEAFVDRIREMNTYMKIPTEVPGMKALDVKEVARRAMAEAHGELHSALTSPLSWAFDLGYPNPKYMTQAECEKIVARLLPADQRA